MQNDRIVSTFGGVDTNKADVSMTTKDVAEVTGKMHKHVLVDTEKMFTELEIRSDEFSADYKDSQNRAQKMYILPKKLLITLIAGYDIKTRYALVNRIEELEAKLNEKQQLTNPTDIVRYALQQLEAKDKEILNLQENLDHSLDYVSILKVANHNKVSENSFNWRLLKAKSIELDYPVKKIQSPRYGYQNLYSVLIFKEIYPHFNYSFDKQLTL